MTETQPDETQAAPADQVTVADLDQVMEHYAFLQSDKKMAEAQVTKINIEIMKVEAKLVEYLKALKRKKYSHSMVDIEIKPRWHVGMPQSDLDKAKLFDWFKEKGVFEKYAVVNSAALNSLWLAERDSAIAADPTAALDFNLPGLPPPSFFEGIKKKVKSES